MAKEIGNCMTCDATLWDDGLSQNGNLSARGGNSEYCGPCLQDQKVADLEEENVKLARLLTEKPKTKKTDVATNLLGRKVRISSQARREFPRFMESLAPLKDIDVRRMETHGEIVAVYKADGALALTVLWGTWLDDNVPLMWLTVE